MHLNDEKVKKGKEERGKKLEPFFWLSLPLHHFKCKCKPDWSIAIKWDTSKNFHLKKINCQRAILHRTHMLQL